jgi:hypothetical protein
MVLYGENAHFAGEEQPLAGARRTSTRPAVPHRFAAVAAEGSTHHNSQWPCVSVMWWCPSKFGFNCQC